MTKNFEHYYDVFDRPQYKKQEERITSLIRSGDAEGLKNLISQGGVFLNFLIDCNDGFYSPTLEAYMQNAPECAKVLLAAGGLPMLQNFDAYYTQVCTIRQFVDGKDAPFEYRYNGESGEKWEEVAAFEEDLYPEQKEEVDGLDMARKRIGELRIAKGVYENDVRQSRPRSAIKQSVEVKSSTPKKEKTVKKDGIRKVLDLEKKAQILDEDEKVAALRHEREDILAAATAGIKDPKKKNAVLRRINVQDLRDKEGKARATRLGKLLKDQQAGK